MTNRGDNMTGDYPFHSGDPAARDAALRAAGLLPEPRHPGWLDAALVAVYVALLVAALWVAT